MLPPQLSEELCSLQPGVDRLAFSAFFTLDRDGTVLDSEMSRTIIKSVIPSPDQFVTADTLPGPVPSSHTLTHRPSLEADLCLQAR